MPIKENQQIAPINPYAVTKVYQDLISQVYHKSFNLNIITTECFLHECSKIKFISKLFAKQIVLCENNKAKYLKHGNLNSIRTLVDINDAISLLDSQKKGKTEKFTILVETKQFL